MRYRRSEYGYTAEDESVFIERGARMSDGGTAWLIWLRAEPGELEYDEHGAFTSVGGVPARTLRECQGPGGWDYEPRTAAESEARTDWMVHRFDAGSLAEAKDTADRALAERGAAK